MKRRYNPFILLFFLLLSALVAGMGGCVPSKFRRSEKVIGLSQHTMGDQWRKAMVRDMQAAISEYDSLRLEVRDAADDPDKQVAQIRELIDAGVDVLVISPIDSQSVVGVVEEAYRKGIPTIVTDRKINSDKFTTFIGGDNYEIGRKAGAYAVSKTNKPELRIAEIWGLSSSTPAQERHRGFTDAVREKGIRLITDSIQGHWRSDSTRLNLPKLSGKTYDLVYSHNDAMAIAAYDYFHQNNKINTDSLLIIGVDAVPEAGLEAVADGRIDASFLYPTAGEEIVRTAVDILDRKPVADLINLPTLQIDSQSAHNMLALYDRLKEYQGSVVRKKDRLTVLHSRFRFLENSLGLILILCLSLFALVIYIWRINRQIRMRNRELREKNRIEEEQSRKLILLNEEIEKATTHKLQFFTNISHEIRTPLTLILAPVQKLVRMTKNTPYQEELLLIERNAQRLLQQVNEMLDFRKIDEGNEVLELREIDPEPFFRNIKSCFDSIARIKEIDYTFSFSQMPDSPSAISVDPIKMDKIVTNLLSNAFKFTPAGGIIKLDIQIQEHRLEIRLCDSGEGIPDDIRQKIFERFFSTGSHGVGGSGIGLYLVGEYVSLHNGSITLEPIPGYSTCFKIEIPLAAGETKALPPMRSEGTSYTLTPADSERIHDLIGKKTDYRLLIVEDDEEIRNYLATDLSDIFTVFTVPNGEEALRLLDRESVSVVISDVMMPGITGFELCRRIKEDIDYAHIPVVLLTALNMEQHQLYGLATGADIYIAKPFSGDFIKASIVRLLDEKEKERRRILQRLEQETPLSSIDATTPDERFLAQLNEILEEVYPDSDYNVERISERMNMSRGHLYRKVKEMTTLTPVELLRSFRLRKAHALLQSRTFHVSEVAYQTGFSSPAYFSKCYKQKYGKTPSGVNGEIG